VLFVDAQRQRQHGNQGEARLLPQHSRAEAQVLPQVCNHICPPVCSEHDGFWIGGSFNALQSAHQ